MFWPPSLRIHDGVLSIYVYIYIYISDDIHIYIYIFGFCLGTFATGCFGTLSLKV